jgi:hypothetical protein
MEGIVDTNEGVEPFEDLIDRLIPAPTVPPSLNHSLVVAINGEMPAICASASEVVDETLEANSLRPTNVTLAL